MEETLVFDTPMTVSAIILVLTFAGIFTEGLHHIHRTKIAMLGAASMVLLGQLFGFYGPEGALEAIDWNVVFLLGAMMTIISIMIPTGGFQAIAYRIAAFSKGRLVLLLTLLGSVVTVISMMLDNVTTVVIFGPLIVLICQALRVNPIPYLMGAAILANTGGVATLVGDPTALMIGSSAGIDFVTFFQHMGGIVLAAWLSALVALVLLFRRKLSVTPDIPTFDNAGIIEDKKTWYAALAVLLLMIFLFIFHHSLHWDAWVVAVMGLTIMMFVNRKKNLDEYLENVEMSLLVFFCSLFALIGGVEHSHLLEWVGAHITPLIENDMLTACIAMMWATAILSALIDNIPFTAAMISVIMGIQAQGVDVSPLWWALAVGAGMGGSGSHLGSTAGVFIVTMTERMAEKENKPSLAITPSLWLCKGTPVMLVTLITASLVMWAFFDFYATPLSKDDAHQHTAQIEQPLEDHAANTLNAGTHHM